MVCYVFAETLCGVHSMQPLHALVPIRNLFIFCSFSLCSLISAHFRCSLFLINIPARINYPVNRLSLLLLYHYLILLNENAFGCALKCSLRRTYRRECNDSTLNSTIPSHFSLRLRRVRQRLLGPKCTCDSLQRASSPCRVYFCLCVRDSRSVYRRSVRFVFRCRRNAAS